jgi:hypothetical protein
MNIRTITALAAVATASQLLQVTPALATSIAQDRHSTDLVAQLLGDARLARVALTDSRPSAATEYIASASAASRKLVRLREANGESMVVQIYTELDNNAALSGDFMLPDWGMDDTRAGHLKALEVTYFAINLDTARAQLQAARQAIRGRNDLAAEKSLAAIRSSLIHGNNAADVPLLTARRDLALAQQAVTSNQPSAASADLERASDSLNSYSSAGRTSAVHQLAADIHSSMAVNANNGPTAATKIDGWWASVKSWFSQHA